MFEKVTKSPGPKTSHVGWLLSTFLVLLIALGVSMRFSRLGYANYWENEANAAQVLSGIDANQMREELANKTQTFGYLRQRYQSRNPNATLSQMMNVLITSHIGHAPGYYTLLFFWTGLLDSHRGTVRMLSCVLSLLQLPAMYFLVIELFGSPVAALLSVCILALSPFQLLYAQEVSEYSFFAAIICLANLCVLRAMRTRKALDWLVYGLVAAAGFAVSINMAYLVVAHAMVVAIEERPQRQEGNILFSKNLILFLVAALLAAILIAPYAYVMIQHMVAMGSTGLDFVANKVKPSDLLSGWGDVLTSPYYALGSVKTLLPIKLLATLLSIFALVYTASVCQGRARSLLLLTTIVPFLFVFIPDVTAGGSRSTLPKYIMPVPLALTVMIAYMFCNQFASKRVKGLWRLLAYGCLASLLSLEIWACSKILSEKSHAYMPEAFDTVAAVLNQDKGSTVVSQEQPSQMNIHQLLCLSHVVDPETRLMWLDNPDELVLPPKVRHFYTYNPPDPLVYLLGTYGYRLQPVKNIWYFGRADVQQTDQ